MKISKDSQKIIQKLPENLQICLQKEDFLVDEWTPQWQELAKKLMIEMNQCRDKSIITKEEHTVLYRELFYSFGSIGDINDTKTLLFAFGIPFSRDKSISFDID